MRQAIERILRNKIQASVLRQACLGAPYQTMMEVGSRDGFYALCAKSLGMTVTQTLDWKELRLDSKFDIVIWTDGLGSLVDPPAALKRLAIQVAPGGRLVLYARSPRSARRLIRYGRANGLILSSFERPLPLSFTILFRNLSRLAHSQALSVSQRVA